MDPLTMQLILSGASVLPGLISGSRGRGKFKFRPEENDPYYLLQRRRALEETGRDRGRTLNEINRAGLLGTSSGFGVLGEQESRGARMLEDVSADSLARQRQEQLALFMDEQQASDRSREMSMQSLGSLGESIPYFLNKGNESNLPYETMFNEQTRDFNFLDTLQPRRGRRDMLSRYDRYGGIY